VVRIDVDKSAYHHLSQHEIGSDKPCSRHLSDLKVRWRVYCDVAISSDWPTGFHIGSTEGHLFEGRGGWKITLARDESAL
jgi:hypothetical protein